VFRTGLPSARVASLHAPEILVLRPAALVLANGDAVELNGLWMK
jgi:hypothetical protein